MKLGAQIARYETLASLGITPPVLASGHLADGTSILVQPFIPSRTPTRKDFADHLPQFARIIHRIHLSPELQALLPPAGSEHYSEAGLAALDSIRRRWEKHRRRVPEAAGFVEESLERLAQQVRQFEGAGLVASHNDICNANWLITPEGQIYLVDLELMALDDPALDCGALLWWYYPPHLRQRFLEICGYADDEPFRLRMQVRMALHCLSIILPREHSFDPFDPAAFAQELTDFRAMLAGEENPQGYAEG
ncbi:MAG: aminoglycoside phosphotransferase family protein [Anaerolineales bacterium]|nr:aminoglycoside phosphotransferase family protein [Anaerolineales bacterium]